MCVLSKFCCVTINVHWLIGLRGGVLAGQCSNGTVRRNTTLPSCSHRLCIFTHTFICHTHTTCKHTYTHTRTYLHACTCTHKYNTRAYTHRTQLCHILVNVFYRNDIYSKVQVNLCSGFRDWLSLFKSLKLAWVLSSVDGVLNGTCRDSLTEHCVF